MLELLHTYWPALVALVLGSGGGGLLGAWVTVKKTNIDAEKNRLDHEATTREREGKNEAEFRDDLLARVKALEDKVETLSTSLTAARSRAATAEAAQLLAEGKALDLEQRLARTTEQHRAELEREKARRRFAEATADHLSVALEEVEQIDDADARSRFVSKTFNDHLRRARITMHTPAKPLIASLEETTERRESEPDDEGDT